VWRQRSYQRRSSQSLRNHFLNYFIYINCNFIVYYLSVSTNAWKYYFNIILYRVFKKSLCTWWLQHTSFLPHDLAQSDCLGAECPGQRGTRPTLTPSVITNSNYVIMVSDWNCLKYFCVFFAIIRCTETFWSPCIISFIHLAVCLTTGPKPLPKRALHIVQSRDSSFRCDYPLLSLRSSSSFLRLLHRLPVTSIPPFIFPSITCCRRKFLHKF
jgi:hypothetical protein